MNEFLVKTNYPKLNVYEFEYGDTVISKMSPDVYVLNDKGKQYMVYNTKTHETAMGCFAHYHFAHGHTVCTGLGFGGREKWILNKPSVTHLTIIEKNPAIIKYNKLHNPDLMKNAEVICADANHVKMECDVLLVDHHPDGDVESTQDIWFNTVANTTKNIKSKITWWWPIEEVILYNKSISPNLSLIDIYNDIVRNYKLLNMPKVDEKFLEFLMTYCTNK